MAKASQSIWPIHSWSGGVHARVCVCVCVCTGTAERGLMVVRNEAGKSLELEKYPEKTFLL